MEISIVNRNKLSVIRPQPKDPNSIERKGFDGLAEPGAPEPICSGPGCHGRRHFEHKPTETTVWRPGRRKLVAAHDGNSYPRLQGKKMLEEPMPPEKRRAERNHMKDIAYLSGYDRPGYVEITDVQFDHKKQVRRDDGMLARDFVSLEASLEKEMGIKRRVPTNRRQRNDIPRAYAGDKLYGAAEYAPGFYTKQQSLFEPGSTARPSQYEPAAIKDTYDTEATADPAGHVNFRPRFSFREKGAARSLADQVHAVRGLVLDDPDPED